MTYAPMPFGKGFILALFGFMAIVAVVFVAAGSAGSDGGPPLAFAVLWLGALAWNGYWWLLRFAVELRLTDGMHLEWSAPLRSGRIRIHDLTEIRPMRFGSNGAVFEVEGERSVIVMATKGLRGFTEEISSIRPDLPVRLGRQAGWAERMPGQDRLKRH